MSVRITVDGQLRVRQPNLPVLRALLDELLTAPWHRALMSGADFEGPFFAWCDRATPEQSLPELLDNMRWPVGFDAEGNATLTFAGEKLGDEEHILDVLAPAIDPGSSLVVTDAGGNRWRGGFDGTGLITTILE